MRKQKALWFTTVLAVLLMTACGEKEPEVAPQAEAPATQAKTPVDPATVGSLTGKVTFEGAQPKRARIMMDQDPVCVQKHSGPVLAEDGMVNNNGTLPNVFVYVKAGAEKYGFPTPSEPAVLDQDGCVYKPHVLGLMVGQTLKITSSDPTSHNVHPMPKNNREWNLSQAPGSAPLEQKFSRPEIMVPVKCNQHPWMRAYVGVTNHPLYAVTGSDGTFTIQGLPPGEYTLEAWTATFGAQEQKVTVGPKESKSVNFTFKSS